MTAWQRLIAGSTLSSGTAWEHLNAQGGGGSAIYVYGELDMELLDQTYSVDVVDEIEIDLDDDVTVELENETL